MAQDWRDQLQSDDPKVRAQAVKELALSGKEENLLYLRSLVENDPDPRVREYAKKAARHLYSSLQSQEPEKTAPPKTTVREEPVIKKEPSKVSGQSQDIKEEDISSSDIKEAATKVQRAFSLHTAGQTTKALKIYTQALEINPYLIKDSYARSVAGELVGKTPDEALRILKDPASRGEVITASKGKGKKTKQKSGTSSQVGGKDQVPKKVSRRTLVQSWLSFFQMTEDFFEAEEEKANHEDTFLSVLVSTVSAVVLFLISGSLQFKQVSELLAVELPELSVNMGGIFLAFLIGTVILTPLSFYANVGLQFLGVRLFGGVGDFKSHAYLMALIQVPTTILGAAVSLLSFVPVIGFIAGLAGFGLSIYTIVVTVRSIKVVHNVTTGRAIGGMLAVPLALSIIGGCIMVIFGSALTGILAGMG